VVISIIALLIAILLPALAKAREAADTARCAVNIRSGVVAVLLYVDEHKDEFPHSGNDWFRDAYIGKYLSAKYLDLRCPGAFKAPNQVWAFPNDEPTWCPNRDLIGWPGQDNFKVPGSNTNALRLATVKKPGQSFVLGDGNYRGAFRGDTSLRVSDGRLLWYSHQVNKANIAYLDGHVKLVASDANGLESNIGQVPSTWRVGSVARLWD
jgi:prepilin-type processing-associated H-X9-DG protein